jgi:hypothetical protein
VILGQVFKPENMAFMNGAQASRILAASAKPTLGIMRKSLLSSQKMLPGLPLPVSQVYLTH